MSARKIDRWHAAGLIDDATKVRLLAYEADHARPLALWAVIGIGVLAVALGIISVVAANWDEVPPMVRLSVHLGLVAALAVSLFAWGDRLHRRSPWALEGGLFVLAILGMAFFGHLGQVYQTDSPLWKPLAAWLLLFAPLLLLRGQSWIVAILLVGVTCYAPWDYLSADVRWFGPQERDAPWMWYVTVTSLPVFLAVAAAWMRRISHRAVFWLRIEQLVVAYAVGGASIATMFAFEEARKVEFLSITAQLVRFAIGMAAASAIWMADRSTYGRAVAAIVAASATVFLLAYPVAGHATLAALLFMALWLAVAAASLAAGWRVLFQFAVAAIALRLIILSFELASDLLTSGFGLIVAGLLILGVAGAAVWVTRRFAPPRAPDTGDAA